MVMCAVFGCNNNNNKKSKKVGVCRYFSFPRDQKVCDEWIRRCCRTNKFNAKNSRICSDHFTENDYCLRHKLLNYSSEKWKLKPDAIPSLKLPELRTKKAASNLKRMKISNKRRFKEIVDQPKQELDESDESNISEDNMTPCCNEPHRIENNDYPLTKSTATQTERDNYVKLLEEENKKLKEANRMLAHLSHLSPVSTSIFTEGQLRKLQQDTQSKITGQLRIYLVPSHGSAAGPKAYRLLRK